MTETKEHRDDFTVERIYKALEPFAFKSSVRDKIAKEIYRNIQRIPIKEDLTLLPNYLNFEKKVNEVVKYFEDEKLTLKQYLNAAIIDPRLFIQKPKTIESNIRGLVERFAPEGLTVEEYLFAALKEPALFFQKPETIENNVRGLVDRFSKEGLTVKQYLTAAIKSPELFTCSPKTVENHVRDLVKCFSAEGLKVENYLTPCLKHPPLFIQLPQTIEKNIRDLVKNFSAEGLTVEKYLVAAINAPPLFSQSPETISSHIRQFFDLYDQGVLKIKNTDPQAPHRAVLDALLKYPPLLSLAEENISQRQALALVTGKQISFSSISIVPKSKIRAQLTKYIQSLDHMLPVWTQTDDIPAETPQTTINVNSVEYGEKLLVDLAKRGVFDLALNTLILSKTSQARA